MLLFSLTPPMDGMLSCGRNSNLKLVHAHLNMTHFSHNNDFYHSWSTKARNGSKKTTLQRKDYKQLEASTTDVALLLLIILLQERQQPLLVDHSIMLPCLDNTHILNSQFDK